MLQRAELLEALTRLQATPQELSLMTSLTSVQTKGLKRTLAEGSSSQRAKDELDSTCDPVSSLAGSGKKRRRAHDDPDPPQQVADNANVVGLEVGESSDDEDSQSSETGEAGEEDQKPDDNPEQVQPPAEQETSPEDMSTDTETLNPAVGGKLTVAA